MKTNVTFFNKQFFVNEEKNTVVVKLDFCIDLNKVKNIDTIIDFAPVQEYLSTLNYIRFDEDCECDCKHCDCVMPDAGVVYFTVYGKSKAAGDDNFDPAFGKKLALTRAQVKAYKKASNFYDTIMSIVCNNTTNGLYNLCVGADNSWLKCAMHEDKLLIPYTPQDAADTPETDND